MLIQARNTLTDPPYAQKTYLTNQEVSGTNTLRWGNPDIFSASWAIQVGETGENQSEIVLLGTATPAGTAGTLTANTVYEHPTNTPVYAVKYDQIVFERSTGGTTGTAAPITNGTLTIQANSQFTTFDDTTGSSSYAYRTYFRNSILNVTTTESDWITSSGFSFYSLGAIRQRVKDKLWNPNYLQDQQIDDWTNEWQDVMTNAVNAVNQDYNLGTVDVGFTGNQSDGSEALGTITSTNFKQVRRIWITYDGGASWYKSTKIDSNDFTPIQLFNTTHPYHYWQGDNIIGIKPSTSSGTARIEYYKNSARLVNDTDVLPVPMQPYTDSFVNYSLANAYLKDDKLEKYQAKMQESNQAKALFVQELTPRDKSGPTFVNIVEEMSGSDGFWF
jgi:hypothetical protein